MTIKITAGIVFFNDAKGLRRCLSSLEDGVDKIICIDGKFPDFEAESNLSDDGSREVVKEFSKAILVDLPADEVTKRNKYLELCETDYLLPIDTDEYVVGNWTIFKTNIEQIVTPKYNIYSVRAKPAVGQAFWPRLWYKPQEMEYFKCHNIFRNKRTGDLLHSPTSAAELIDGITIRTDDNLRTDAYNKSVQKYQDFLTERENTIRTMMFGMTDNRM